MKTLMIMRHAKASHDEGLDDFDRPLTERGERDATRMGEWLRKEGRVPEIILASPALRARSTAEWVRKAAGHAGEVEARDEFYPGEPKDYLNVLRERGNSTERVMVVGHNPGVEGLVQQLCRTSVEMPTSAIVEIGMEIGSWGKIDRKSGGEIVQVWLAADAP